jgi:hypothetical protein
MDASGFRCSQDGPKILGILNTVEDHQECRSGVLKGMVKEVLFLGIGFGSDQADNPLMPSMRNESV